MASKSLEKSDTHRLPIRSTKTIDTTTAIMLTSWFTTVMMKGSTLPSFLMYTVPYLFAKVLPVSWRKKLTPHVIRVRFRLVPFQRSKNEPFSVSSWRIDFVASNSSLMSSSVKHPVRNLRRAASASSSRPLRRSHLGDYWEEY